mgnify:CR=1 FL=1
MAEPVSRALSDYCQGFARAAEPWPGLPLPNDTSLNWWDQLITDTDQGVPLQEALVAALPQLQLPQVSGISTSDVYKTMVLRGQVINEATLATAGQPPQWECAEALRLWIAPHPCGAMPVLQTPSWHDFELLVRALAHRAEPVVLPDGVHAQAVSGLIHWGLIERFGRDSRAKLILLHQAPYGSVAAEHVPGRLSAEDWLAASTTLRLEHELTHLATKRLLGEMRLNLLDELVADCMGMVAALGHFDADLFGRCLGINTDNANQPIANGRWLSYTRELSDDDAKTAVALTLTRSRELDARLNQQSELLKPEHAMARLQWLCQQRLDQQLTAPAATQP